MELHRVREIQRHVAQRGTFIGELMEDEWSDELARKLDVAKGRTETDTDECQKGVDVGDVET